MGPPVPATAAPGKELRQSLPSALVEALDEIGHQIEIEILDPLLCAASLEQLARTFERVFLKFRHYYLSTVLIVWGFLQEDPQRFSALIIRSFQESELLIRSQGSHWIGNNPARNALHGLTTMIHIAKAATKLFDWKTGPAVQIDESVAKAWANSIIAYVLAFSSVLAALTALANGRAASGRLENVAALADWSKSYTVQAYHFTKALGLLSSVQLSAAIGFSDEEDIALAEVGLDSYAEALRQDDQP
jgi:hypothetical protein